MCNACGKRTVNPTILEKAEFTKEVLDPDYIPIEELIEHRKKKYTIKARGKESRQLINIKMNTNGPIGICHFGDPHIDDDYCDWDNLRLDIDLINSTDCLWAVNLGDVSNNWIGRLQRLWAYQETSAGQAAPIEWRKKGGIAENWNANLKIQFPNGNEARIIGAHDMPGHSMWNPLHAQVRRARFSGSEAHLYISGHRHQWALFQTENAESGRIYWAARARGYKLYDDYANEKGYLPQKYGASITAIIDPETDDPVRFMQCFADTAEAADFLNFKRSGRTTTSGASESKVRRKVTKP